MLDQNQLEELGCTPAGFSLEKTVASGSTFAEYIKIDEPNSLLHFRFTTVDYNIGFSIEKVGKIKLSQGVRNEIKNSAFVRYCLCDSHLKPISKTCLVREPGIYKLIWHNKHSYIKSKKIKYRVRVLRMKEQSIGKKETETDLLSLGELSMD